MRAYQQIFDILKKDAEPQHQDIIVCNEKIIDNMIAAMDEHQKHVAFLATEGIEKPNGKVEEMYRKTVYKCIRHVVRGTIEAVDTKGLTKEQHEEVHELLVKIDKRIEEDNQD